MSTRQWQAFGSALGLEALLVTALVAWVVLHPPKLIETLVPLTIEPLVAEKPDKLPEPEKMRQVPLPQVPVQKLVKAIERPVLPPPLPVVASPVVSAPANPALANPEPALATSNPNHIPAVKPLAPSQVPPAPTVDPALAYNAKLVAAVQAAFEVPAAAAALNFKGRTRVEFNLVDGVVSAIRVVQSSGLGAADRAALKAVQFAAFPSPPPALQGREGSYQIWVACL